MTNLDGLKEYDHMQRVKHIVANAKPATKSNNGLANIIFETQPKVSICTALESKGYRGHNLSIEITNEEVKMPCKLCGRNMMDDLDPTKNIIALPVSKTYEKYIDILDTHHNKYGKGMYAQQKVSALAELVLKDYLERRINPDSLSYANSEKYTKSYGDGDNDWDFRFHNLGTTMDTKCYIHTSLDDIVAHYNSLMVDDYNIESNHIRERNIRRGYKFMPLTYIAAAWPLYHTNKKDKFESPALSEFIYAFLDVNKISSSPIHSLDNVEYINRKSFCIASSMSKININKRSIRNHYDLTMWPTHESRQIGAKPFSDVTVNIISDILKL